MIIISLGFSCYIKNLIKNTKYNKSTDIFDWMNSFLFNKLIESLENDFNNFSQLIKSPIIEDLQKNNVYYNDSYFFRLPHEEREFNLETINTKYNRRFLRFKNYKNSDENFLFIRIINNKGHSGFKESLKENYSEECYNKIMKHLPKKSKILLITHNNLTEEDKYNVFHKFYLVDNVIQPDLIAYGDYLDKKNKIIEYYTSCFEYIENNFDSIDTNIIYELIKKSRIGA